MARALVSQSCTEGWKAGSSSGDILASDIDSVGVLAGLEDAAGATLAVTPGHEF
jgi:hypothetical protein